VFSDHRVVLYALNRHVNCDIVARSDQILKLSIFSGGLSERIISKLQKDARSVISVKRSPFAYLSNFGRLKVADGYKLRNSKSKNQQHQMNTTKTLIAGAAVAGLMTGSMAVRAYAAGEPNSAGVSLQTMAEKGKEHACKGQNACKGQGGCKSGDQGCKGKNTCKGKGGCAVKSS
jgi:hypothetical protein